MNRRPARSMLLAAPILIAACSDSSSPPIDTIAPATAAAEAATVGSTSAPASTAVDTTPSVPSSTEAPASTLVPVDPALLIPIAVGNQPFPADADQLVTENQGYTGDPNATLQQWSITPMAVPSGSDVRLLGFARTVGINSTTATFLTGPVDPEAAVAAIRSILAPTPTYTVTPTSRTDGSATMVGFDAQPTTVQGEPPGWTVEVGAVDRLGIVRIKRSDYGFDKVVPTFTDLPPMLQSAVLNQDAIAVTVGGVLSSIAYEYGVASLGDKPTHRTRLGYDFSNDLSTTTTDLKNRLTVGWEVEERADVVYFTSTTTSETWTLDATSGSTHLTYDTGN